MTHYDNGHYAAKHKGHQEPNPVVVELLKERAADGEASCAVAHQIAEEVGLAPAEVGRNIDLLEIKIVKCQLGLFGYRPENRKVKPADEIEPGLEEAIKAGLKDGSLFCSEAWAIADRMGLTKMAVSSACEKLGLRIRRCQLGAF